MSWSRLIWHSNVVPRHAYVAWLAVLGKLPTLDRLNRWGLVNATSCWFCEKGHIFFECIYSKCIWEKILGSCGISRRIVGWFSEFHWTVNKFKGKSLLIAVLCVAWCAYIYHIWKKRNSRLHGGQKHYEQQVLEQIKWEVGVNLSKLQNIKKDRVNSNLVAA